MPLSWSDLDCNAHLFFTGTFILAHAVYSMTTFPKYQATVIGFDSAWVEVEREDSDGTSYKTDVLMHTPTLRFIHDTGRIITQKSNIRSSSEPVIGTKAIVAYRSDGQLHVISLASIGLYIGLAIMMLINGYILTKVLFFVLGRKSKRLDEFGWTLISVVLIGGMLSMFAGMTYGVYSYFQPGSDIPLSAMLFCLFASLMLVLAFFGLFFVPKKVK